MLKNILDFITDEEFLGGVATGISETIDESNKRAARSQERLNDWAMRIAERKTDKFDAEVAENDKALKELASQLSDDQHNANSQEVKSAAMYLVQTYGLDGAQTEATRLSNEKLTYGTSPLLTLSIKEGPQARNFTFSEMARDITTKPSAPKIGESGIKVRRSFTDKLFGFDSYDKDIQASLDAAMADTLTESEVIPILESNGYDPDLIIRSKAAPREEIARFKSKLREVQKDDPSAKLTMDLIKNKIKILEIAKDTADIGSATELPYSEHRRIRNDFVAKIGEKYDLDIKGNIIQGDLITYEESNAMTQTALEFSRKAIRDINDIKLSGNRDYIAEVAKIEAAIALNKAYEVKERDNGIKYIQLLEEEVALRGFPDDTNNIVIDTSSVAEVDAQAAQQSNVGGNASAYLNTTVTDPASNALANAIKAYKALPDRASPADKLKARRVVQKIVMQDPQNSGKSPTEINNIVDSYIR